MNNYQRKAPLQTVEKIGQLEEKQIFDVKYFERVIKNAYYEFDDRPDSHWVEKFSSFSKLCTISIRSVLEYESRDFNQIIVLGKDGTDDTKGKR